MFTFIAYAETKPPGIVEGLNKILPTGFANIFSFGLQIGLAIAFGTIIYAGFLYMTSGDNPSKTKEANAWILAAVEGLIILAGAYILLNTISPKLTEIKEIVIPEIPAYLSKSAPALPAAQLAIAPADAINYIPQFGNTVDGPGRFTNVTGLRGDAGRDCEVHTGTDIAADSGTPVKAAGDGLVQFFSDAGGYGNMATIDHSGGYKTVYGHLSSFVTALQNKQVKAGEVIGYVGSTGRSTGPHLHFEIRKGGLVFKTHNLFGRNSRYGDAVSFLKSQVTGSGCPLEMQKEYHGEDGLF